jgi:uncharacterized protein (DUF1330 family)
MVIILGEMIRRVEPFGGKFIARGGKLTVLEGEWAHPRTVIIEFPSREAAEGWRNTPQYRTSGYTPDSYLLHDQPITTPR